MSPAAHAVKRATGAGVRWYVRFRVGGRGSRLRHAGTAYSIKERDALLRRVRESLAATGDFRPEPERSDRTLAAAGDEYFATRHDLRPNTVANQQGILAAVDRELGPHRLVSEIDVPSLQQWLATLVADGRKPGTIRLRLAVLRAVLDHEGIDPSPARDPRIRLPKLERAAIEPPTAAEVQQLVAHLHPKHALVVRVLEATGLRISELIALTWADVDRVGSRLRVAGGKTQAARRWVPVDPALLQSLGSPREPGAHVFPGLSASTIRNAMRDACAAAGMRLLSPHKLRHRYISKKVLAGESIIVVQQLAGHSRPSMTLDTYSHVILED